MPKTSKSKFIQLYESFSPEEKKEFRLYIKSPLINNKRDYSVLLNKIDSEQTFLSNNLIKKNNSTQWNRLSELSALAVKYLIMKGSDDNEYYKDRILLEQLYLRKRVNIFSYECDKIISKAENPHSDLASFSDLGEFYYFKSRHSLIKNDYKGIIESNTKSSNYLTADFLINILDRMSEIYFQKANKLEYKTLDTETLVNLINIEEYLIYLKKTSSEFYNHVSLSYYLCKFIKSPAENTEFYYKAIEIFTTKMKKISKFYKSGYYFVLINYGIYLRNLKLLKDDIILFELFEKKINEGFDKDISEEDLNLNRFSDYVIIALNLKKIKWVEDFIKKYSTQLPVSFRENKVNLAIALLEFEKGNPEKALESQCKIEKSNHIFYLVSSKLFLKSNCLLGNFEECYQEIERLRKFSVKYKDAPFNSIPTLIYFVKTFTALLKYKQTPDKKNKSNLEYLIKSKESFAEKKWFVEIADKL